MNFIKISTVIIFLFCFFSTIDLSFSQVIAKPKPKIISNAALLKSQEQNDSLINAITDLNEILERVSLQNKIKDSIIDELDATIRKLNNINSNIESKLSTYKGVNLKLDQSNRILIIFNAVVGILLLTTLIWFLRNIGRRKTSEKNTIIAANEISSTSNSKMQSSKKEHQYFDSKLEQLEKLGELKQKGVLNEEEFNRQKQQILGGS